jgi:hypothetical protein
MNLGKISLHELTSLQVDLSGQRVRHQIPRTTKKIPGSQDHLGNIINPRPFVNSRKRRREEIEESPASASDSVQTESDDRELGRRKKRRGDRYFPEVLPYLHPPGASNSAREDCLAGSANNGLPSSVWNICLCLSFIWHDLQDLLKTIHHFASHYYSQRGLLTASSRAKRAKSYLNAKLGIESGIVSGSDSIQEDNSKEGTDNEERSSSLLRKGKEIAAKGRVKGRDSVKVNHMESLGVLPTDISHIKQLDGSNKIKDMYRAFDGTTLLLIGMYS